MATNLNNVQFLALPLIFINGKLVITTTFFRKGIMLEYFIVRPACR